MAQDEKLHSKFYELIPDPEDVKKWVIKILIGPCKDTIVRYGRLKLTPEEEKQGGAPFVFEWTFVKPIPEQLKDIELSDADSKDFEVLLANIALELLEDWFLYEESMKGFNVACQQSETEEKE